MHGTLLSREVKRTLVVSPGTAAASTAPKKGGSHVDMSAWEGVSFVCNLSADTGSTKTVAMKAQGSTSSTAWSDLTGASVQTDARFGAGTLQLDIYRPVLGDAGKYWRYVRPYLTVTSTASNVGGVLAEQYGPHTMPVSQPTSSILNSTADAKCVVSPGSTT